MSEIAGRLVSLSLAGEVPVANSEHTPGEGLGRRRQKGRSGNFVFLTYFEPLLK